MIPRDIKQVIERLKARGLVGYRAPEATPHMTSLRKTERAECKWCGKVVSAVFGKHHVCKPRRLNIKPLLLALLLPLCGLSQSKVSVPVVFLDARVTFIQPSGKEAKVYTRKKSGDSWQLWQLLPRNPIPGDQVVILALPQPITGTTQCQVVFQ